MNRPPRPPSRVAPYVWFGLICFGLGFLAASWLWTRTRKTLADRNFEIQELNADNKRLSNDYVQIYNNMLNKVGRQPIVAHYRVKEGLAPGQAAHSPARLFVARREHHAMPGVSIPTFTLADHSEAPEPEGRPSQFEAQVPIAEPVAITTPRPMQPILQAVAYPIQAPAHPRRELIHQQPTPPIAQFAAIAEDLRKEADKVTDASGQLGDKISDETSEKLNEMADSMQNTADRIADVDQDHLPTVSELVKDRMGVVQAKMQATKAIGDAAKEAAVNAIGKANTETAKGLDEGSKQSAEARSQADEASKQSAEAVKNAIKQIARQLSFISPDGKHTIFTQGIPPIQKPGQQLKKLK